jgi:uncharacterized SAM-binding protein YcdF (DUF218 family)
MNELLLTLGLEGWKPLLGTLLLPPIPFLLLTLAGTRLMFRSRLLAWLMVLLGAVGIWLSCTPAIGQLLNQALLQPPPALNRGDIAELKRAPKTAVVVLGSGRRALAPEYGVSTLNARSVERLRYGIWLSRETDLPLAFSGGIGHGAPDGNTEAEIAARITEREFGHKLRWQEGRSRDTRENARYTVALLQAQGIEHIVLVSHQYHMKRALRNFARAVPAEGPALRLTAAPLGVRAAGPRLAGDWVPTAEGFEHTRTVLHEWLGLLAGA